MSRLNVRHIPSFGAGQSSTSMTYRMSIVKFVSELYNSCIVDPCNTVLPIATLLYSKILNDREVGPLDTITIGNGGYYTLRPTTIGITERLLFVSIVNWEANSEPFSVGCTTTDIFIMSKPGTKLNRLLLRVWFR